MTAPDQSTQTTFPLKRSSQLTALVLLFLALPMLAGTAFARSWRIADFQDNISIASNGTALVREKITLVFVGSFQGIHRTIPIEYPGPGGTNYTLFLKVINVTSEDGAGLVYESHRNGDFRDLKIYVPGADDATRTVEITYKVLNGVRYFPDHDEFYWNVTGNDWPVPIDHVAASVQFPNDAAGSLRAQAFTGVYGSKDQDATSQIQGSTVSFESNNPLPMRGGMTIDVYLPKGILTEPSGFTRAWWFLASNPIILLPLWTLIVMFVLWWYKGRDPDPGRSVAPMYEPPPGMSPAEAGTLVQDKVHPRDITSTIIDLAVRGYIKIEEVEDTSMVFFHHKDYEFHLLKPEKEWQGLAPHETVMLANVFDAGDVVRLSSLKNRFYTAIPTIREDIMASLRSKNMYLLDPESANGYSVAAAVVIAAPFIIAQFLGWDVFSSVPMLILAIAVSALIWWLFARVMSAKTVKGAQTTVAVLGFQEFMNRVDADRLKTMPTNTFEKFLPYAMALGVEHHWAKAFQGIVQDPPTWYAAPGGYGMFNPIFFTNSMSGMAMNMQQVFVSAPRASSTGSGFGGGGFGGGGFSGGGFGGGGGGAF